MHRLIQLLEEERGGIESSWTYIDLRKIHCSYEIVKFILHKEEINANIHRLRLFSNNNDPGQEHDMMQWIRDNPDLE